MPRNRVVSIQAIAAFAGALVAGGCVSAATKPPAAAATASARAAAGGTANIMIYGVGTDGAYWHAIVAGVVGDYGPAVSIYPGGQVDPAHNSEVDLRLTQGSFRLSIGSTMVAALGVLGEVGGVLVRGPAARATRLASVCRPWHRSVRVSCRVIARPRRRPITSFM